MKIRFLLAIAILCSSQALVSQTAPAADSPASKEDVQKLFQVMNVRQQMLQVMDSMVQQRSNMMHENLKRRSPQITDAEMQRLDSVMHEMVKEFPFAAMLNDMIPVYQKHLTKADVAAMSVFYSSPTGQKLMREMPAMTSESTQAAYPTMQAHMEKVMQRIDEMTQDGQKGKDVVPVRH